MNLIEHEAAQVSAPSRLLQLDGLRGLAALWVYLFHVWQFGNSPTLLIESPFGSFDVFGWIRHGPAGVDLFMVLSGFCLFWPVAKNRDRTFEWNWKTYALKRVRRILPAYYAAIAYAVLLPLCLVGLVRFLGWHANTQPLPSAWQLLSHVLLIHTLFRETWDGITGAFWSMGLEAQFYAVFPFLIFAWKKMGNFAIVGAAIASLLFRLVSGTALSGGDSTAHFLLSITFLGRWMQFAAGMGAAVFVAGQLQKNGNFKLRKLVKILLLMGSASVVAGLSEVVTSHIFLPWRDLLLAIGYAGIVAGVCLSGGLVRGLLAGPTLSALGRISYSFFLIHQPTAWYFMELMRKKLGVEGTPQVLIGFGAGLAVTLAIASVFYLLFEKPFLEADRACTSQNSQRQTAAIAGRRAA